MVFLNIQPGQRVFHNEHGEGIIVDLPSDGFVSIFFSIGERRVPVNSISVSLSRNAQIISNVHSGERRKRRAWLYYQSYKLPLIDSAASLTSAKIDLLPHQVVLTHRIATNSPRRFLIADEVGLGKTIETALLLRELASRGELNRAIMVVPAGLVNNWHRELNEVFNLEFEIFGSEGDVTDRRSNAFQKHNRLIASIDTLKRKSRIKKLKEAPPWDLVVFDEAHHLTAYKNGGKVKKTENYKLGEVMKELSRDLILLSATPHQGDNFRFWMLVQLLNPSLFRDVDDMLENRHRLNEIIFRRTKADACRPDGSTLFARRSVQTESFLMTEEERVFYRELVEYLADGFAVANRIGGRGRALGFVMTIFQKIAASSFAAVKRTLQRRLLALTIQEAILHDTNLDIESREASYTEAKEIIRREYNLGNDMMAEVEVEHILSDLKRRIMKKMNEDDLLNASEIGASELDIGAVEDTIFTSINYALPEERHRIKHLLSEFPNIQETKVQKLLYALGVLWNNNPNEKIVIFATYLGTVEMLSNEIEKYYPGQGVTVLKGGDHGSKVAAEKRFKRPDGPKVLISTAAGREGINLQFARVLFNFDLPWNPMDIEQRIGRIHRYGQQYTAQVYNLILSDTIEGKIFLLLDEKLKEIARTLGKVDEFGDVAEDLQSQILGQLSEKLNYENLYKNALNDPELKRTKYELEAAMSNSMEARKAVSQLFQDLDRFSLDEYKPISDVHSGLEAIVEFVHNAVVEENGELKKIDEDIIRITNHSLSDVVFTTNREKSIIEEKIDLLGLDHPLVKSYIDIYRDLEPNEVGVIVKSKDDHKGIVSIWYIESQGERQDIKSFVIPIASDFNGNRNAYLEKFTDKIYNYPVTEEKNEYDRKYFLKELIEPMLHRELLHRGIISKGHDYQTKLIGWIEIV